MRVFNTNDKSDSTTLDRYRFIIQKPRSLPEEMTMTVARRGYKNFSKVTMSTLIKSPVEVCFNLVSKQFEEVPKWNSTIRKVVPASCDYGRVGSKSLVTFDLAGSVEESEVVLHSIFPNKSITWTSNHSSHLQEQWRFERESDLNTIVFVTLSYNPHRGWLKYFNRGAKMHSRIEIAVIEMLRRLKMVAEMPEPIDSIKEVERCSI